MNVSEMTTQNKAKYDIIAETDGIIAVLPLGEIKVESRRQPQAVTIIQTNSLIVLQSAEFGSQEVFGNPALQCFWT